MNTRSIIKYQGDFPEEIRKRLEITAKIAYQLDEEMGKIRDDIQEAQALFDPLSRKIKRWCREIVTIQMKNTGKRVDLIANRKPQSQKVLHELREKLKKQHFILNDTNPDIVISIGGDGMLCLPFTSMRIS